MVGFMYLLSTCTPGETAMSSAGIYCCAPCIRCDTVGDIISFFFSFCGGGVRFFPY